MKIFKANLALCALFFITIVHALKEEAAVVSSVKKEFLHIARNQKLYGLLILCERRGGKPTARLFTSSSNRYQIKTIPKCRRRLVKGRVGDVTKTNHAKLYPWMGEEFDELTKYWEWQYKCTSGRVRVYDNVNKNYPYSCDTQFEAHVVKFLLTE